jgi:hypothetical protein
VAAAHQDHSRRRRDCVEIVSKRQALFGELRFVPVAVRQHDLVLRASGHARGDGLEHVFQGPGPRQIHAGPTPRAVKMVVHQSRNHSRAVEIDVTSVPGGTSTNVGRWTDRRDPAASDRDGLCNGRRLIDGDDVAVVKNQVGWRR